MSKLLRQYRLLAKRDGQRGMTRRQWRYFKKYLHEVSPKSIQCNPDTEAKSAEAGAKLPG